MKKSQKTILNLDKKVLNTLSNRQKTQVYGGLNNDSTRLRTCDIDSKCLCDTMLVCPTDNSCEKRE